MKVSMGISSCRLCTVLPHLVFKNTHGTQALPVYTPAWFLAACLSRSLDTISRVWGSHSSKTCHETNLSSFKNRDLFSSIYSYKIIEYPPVLLQINKALE